MKYFRRTLEGFRSGGRDYSIGQVANAIRNMGWAAFNRDADLYAGPDREQVAAAAQSTPVLALVLAARLEGE